MILKTKRYNTIVTVPRCTRKIIEKSKIDTTNAHLHNLSLQGKVAGLN
jgi:hypothetical protein